MTGGLVVIVCDDPSAISSNNEQDSRPFAKWVELPLLEPSDFQEAKDMTKWAFELSEEMKCIVLIRGQTRISHSRGRVELGVLPSMKRAARFTPLKNHISGLSDVTCLQHRDLLQKLKRISDIFEFSPFNKYSGPESPELLIVTSGICYLYCLEAVNSLGLEQSVGILKLGTLWPLPRNLLKKHLNQTTNVLFVEQVAPFVEDSVRELFPDLVEKTGSITLYGKHSGHIDAVGELNPSVVMETLSKLMYVEYSSRDMDYDRKAKEITDRYVVDRNVTFCPGCPHRATFWTIKNAVKLAGGDGFTTGDIGCYTLAIGPAGYNQLKTMHAMGSGAGLAGGFGQLGNMGFTQPVLAVCGDSTFYHAAIPALVNAVYNQSNFTLLVLDNCGTAMTGFQPHPGTGKTATGGEAPIIAIEKLCDALGIEAEIVDPFDLKAAETKLIHMMQPRGGVRVLIMRRKCELIRGREEKPPYLSVYVDSTKCLGETCGCNRLCTRIFKCPGLIWDRERGKAEIDEVICVKCGVCADICPHSAIIRETKS
jgi:indolepyruvate ferredoxin oxidoreductase alpha subunit